MANRFLEIVYQKNYKYASFLNDGFNPCFYNNANNIVK